MKGKTPAFLSKKVTTKKHGAKVMPPKKGKK